MISIDSDQGRIGELWWTNSDPSTIYKIDVPIAANVQLKLVRWGTFDFGRDIRIAMEPISD